jgi:hypothetical protein
MEDVELEDANEEFDPGEAEATPPVDPAVLAKEIARNLASEAQRGQTRESETERIVRELLNQGHKQEGISTLLKVLDAYNKDKEVERAYSSQQQQSLHVVDECRSRASDALLEYKDKVPKFRIAMPGLEQRVEELITTNGEFKLAQQSLKQGKIPPAKFFEKAAEMAIDEYLDGTVITKREPITVKSSKPKLQSENFDPQGLDPSLRKLYFAVMNNTNGNKDEARRAVERMSKVR